MRLAPIIRNLLPVFLLVGFAGCKAEEPQVETLKPDAKTCRELAQTFEQHLREGHLAKWFPRCIDREHGGYHQDFAADWTPLPDDHKFLVHQSRMAWVAATVAEFDPKLKDEFTRYALHGIEYLDTAFRDREHGGLYWRIGMDGKPSEKLGFEKHAYAISFAIYAAAKVYAVTKDERALALAKDTFAWFDAKAHDAKNRGYFEHLARDGTPLLEPPTPGKRGDVGPYGYKSMNSHIHLLESFTELYGVWKDETLKARLEELLSVVRDTIVVEPGCMNLYFRPDWRAVPAHDSFGHDVETAFLIVEAAEALGLHDDEKTWKRARMLVDHALEYGWDQTNGGFCEKGEAFAPAHDTSKVWWTQAEGLNALLLMHTHYGKETDRYFQRFIAQWRFIAQHQFDAKNGGWHEVLTADGHPLEVEKKGHPWKAAYHDSRALVNCIKHLRALAQ